MIRFVLWGPLACFSRPESPDRLTYPIPTPSALQGVISAIYDHPGVWADVRRIHVLKPIQYLRLGLVQRGDYTRWSDRQKKLTRTSSVKRPTSQTVLRNPAWMIDFEWRFPYGEGNPGKWAGIFKRRLERGEFYYTPSLGLHDYRALVSPPTGNEKPIPQSRDFGMVIHGYDRRGRRPIPHVFHARMNQGVIEVPSFWDRICGEKQEAA